MPFFCAAPGRRIGVWNLTPARRPFCQTTVTR